MVNGKKIYGTIRCNTEEFKDLPEPGVPFEYKDLDMSWSVFQKCALNGWFKRVDRTYNEAGSGRVTIWQTRDFLWDRLEDYRNTPTERYAD